MTDHAISANDDGLPVADWWLSKAISWPDLIKWSIRVIGIVVPRFAVGVGSLPFLDEVEGCPGWLASRLGIPFPLRRLAVPVLESVGRPADGFAVILGEPP